MITICVALVALSAAPHAALPTESNEFLPAVAPKGLKGGPGLVNRLLKMSKRDAAKEIGMLSDHLAVTFDLKAGQKLDWRKALASKDFVKDFPGCRVQRGEWEVTSSAASGVILHIVFGEKANNVSVEAWPAAKRSNLLKAIGANKVSREVKLPDGSGHTLQFKPPYQGFKVTTYEAKNEPTTIEFFCGTSIELEDASETVVGADLRSNKLESLILAFSPNLTRNQVLEQLGLTVESVLIEEKRDDVDGMSEAWIANPKNPVPGLGRIELTKRGDKAAWWLTITARN